MSVNSPSTEHEDELSGYPFIMEETYIQGTVKLNHHKNVQASHVKVSVDEVFEGYEDKPLPAAQPYVKTIGQAFGTSVEWPKHLVFLHNFDDDVEMTQKEQGNPRVDSCGLDKTSIGLTAEHVVQLLDCESISCTIIQVFMLGLMDQYGEKFATNSTSSLE
ncbi:hypothetical protein OROGR_008158 [Orobanche gracilis]